MIFNQKDCDIQSIIMLNIKINIHTNVFLIKVQQCKLQIVTDKNNEHSENLCNDNAY